VLLDNLLRFSRFSVSGWRSDGGAMAERWRSFVVLQLWVCGGERGEQFLAEFGEGCADICWKMNCEWIFMLTGSVWIGS